MSKFVMGVVGAIGLILAYVAFDDEFGEAALKRLAVESNNNVVFRYRLTEVGARKIGHVSVRKSRPTLERALPILKRLDGLKSLQLFALDLTKDDMIAVSELNISKLDISACRIGPDELAPIANLESLETLLMYKEKRVNDEAIGRLDTLGSLKELDLSFSQVTGSCFATGFENLEKLVLDQCPVDDDGLKAIANIHSLKELYISQTKVTFEGLMHVARLHNLEHGGFPDEMPDEKILELGRVHLLAKQKARKEGIHVADDLVSPFIAIERKANVAVVRSRQEDRRLPRMVAKRVARAELTILWLVGRERGSLIFDKVDDRYFRSKGNLRDYTSSTHTVLEILKQDFNVHKDPDFVRPEHVLTPDKEKLVKAYLSGKLFSDESKR